MISTPPKADTSFSTLTPVKFLDRPKTKQIGDQLFTIKARLDTIVKNLLDNWNKWQIAQKRGLSLCTSIEAIKTKCLESRVAGETLFPEELKPYCDKLAIILSVFEDITNNTAEALRQLNAMMRLPGTSEEVFYRTWLFEDFINFTKRVLEKYKKEFNVKKIITEEIAHCLERSDLVRLSSSWEYPLNVDDSVQILFLFISEEIRIKN